MLQFVKGLGFEVTADPDDSSVLLVIKYLQPLLMLRNI
jgi:hypothetical protein